MNRITYFGSEKDITEAIAVLKQHKPENLREADARLLIQKLIDEHHLKASILVNGNRVWGKQRILQNLEKIIKHGTLYNQDQKKPPILSRYFYQFLHLECGSLSHYDIAGWIHRYPTVEHLKKFFKNNEFGKPVREWIPSDKADVKAIVQAIETRMFPFQAYLKTRNSESKLPKRH